MFAVDCRNVTKYFVQWSKRNGRSQHSFPGRALALLTPERKNVPAVRDVCLRVKDGEIFGILGANGSGKSTLIRMMSTLLIPDEGTLEVYGRDVVEKEGEVRTLINRVSVEASFFKRLSAWENLSYAARLYGLNTKQARGTIGTIMERLGFSRDKLGESLETLSRGMQQKVAIARALLTSPMLLLLDEPTTGLDPRSKRQVQEFVREINQSHGITTILTTHDMEEADRLCHRIGIMKEGRLIATGTSGELKDLMTGDENSKISLEEVFLRLSEEEGD